MKDFPMIPIIWHSVQAIFLIPFEMHQITPTFLVEVTLPKATVCNGDQDSLTLTIASKKE